MLDWCAVCVPVCLCVCACVPVCVCVCVCVSKSSMYERDGSTNVNYLNLLPQPSMELRHKHLNIHNTLYSYVPLLSPLTISYYIYLRNINFVKLKAYSNHIVIKL